MGLGPDVGARGGRQRDRLGACLADRTTEHVEHSRELGHELGVVSVDRRAVKDPRRRLDDRRRLLQRQDLTAQRLALTGQEQLVLDSSLLTMISLRPSASSWATRNQEARARTAQSSPPTATVR